MKKTVGIWGAGVVGGATGKLFEIRCPDDVEVRYYDKYKTCSHTKEEVAVCDFIFICLPTPMKRTGAISLEYIYSAFAELRSLNLSYGKEVIIRSTSVSGSSDYLAQIYSEFNVSFMPEFLTEKDPIGDVLNASRIIIGAACDASFERLEKLFRLVYCTTPHFSVPIIRLTRIEAETIKYMHNVMLTMAVLTANEIYLICDKLGVDYEKLQPLLSYDPRLGTFTRVPGHDGDFGVGGKCLIPGTFVRLKGDVLTTNDAVEEGDFIFDGNHYTEITKVGSRYVEELIELKARGRYITGSKDHIQIVFSEGAFQEKTLDKINPSVDKLFIPRQPESDTDTIIIGKVPDNKHRTVWYDKVVLNERIARLIGLYLADGCISDNMIIWTFGEHNEQFADEIVRTLDEDFGIHSRKFLQVSNGTYGISRCWRVNARCQWLQIFLENKLLCGKGAHTKNIIQLAPKIAKPLIGAWLDGDGHNEKNSISGYSRSKRLINSIDTLLLSMGICGIVGHNGEQIGVSTRNEVREIISWTTRHQTNQGDHYIRKHSYASPTCKPADYKGQFGWIVDIIFVTKREGGEVISLETKSGHYVANNILSHNCFPKDLNAFIHLAESKGYTPNILKAGNALNNEIRRVKDWISIPGAVEENKEFC